jgi:hypothetical protein
LWRYALDHHDTAFNLRIICSPAGGKVNAFEAAQCSVAWNFATALSGTKTSRKEIKNTGKP